MSSHPTSPTDQPKSTYDVVRLGNENPNVLKWPIVVDWMGGRASIGDVEGVKEILEALRKERDGESKREDIDQSKGWFS